MYKCLFIFFLLLHSGVLCGQTGQLQKGKVFDFQSKNPLPYVTVFVRSGEASTYSDFEGNFGITCNASDSLSFSSVGYETQKIAAEKLHTNDSVFLRKSNVFLQEIVIERRKNEAKNREDSWGESTSEWLGEEGGRKGCFTGIQQAAAFIENPFRKSVRVQAIRCSVNKYRSIHEEVAGELKTKRLKNKRLLVRLRVYAKSEGGKPSDTDLLKEEIVIEVGKNQSVITFDLQEMRVLLPTNGFFASLELLGLIDDQKNFLPYEQMSKEDTRQFCVKFSHYLKGKSSSWIKSGQNKQWSSIKEIGTFRFKVKVSVPK